LRAAIVAALLVLAPAAAAQAATVTLEYEPPIPEIEPEPAYTLAVEAARGEANRLRVTQDDSGFVVQETGSASLSAKAGCSAAAPGVVRCALPSGARHVSVFVDAGNLADAVALGPLSGLDVAEVLGGPGDDWLRGHAGPDLQMGGTGTDVIAGLDGEDRIDGGPDSDVLDGGEGRDLVTYASHTRPVTADLAAGTGGGRGEHDRFAGFEDLAGGTASDRLFGDSAGNLLFGGLGGRRDTGRGRGGDDTVSVSGRAAGGSGDDVVDAERVECGRGSDVAFRQRFEPPGPYARACERIRWFFYIVTRPRIVRGALVVRFTCPVPDCRGTVSVHDSRGVLGTQRYVAVGPRTRRLRVELDRKPVSRIGRFVITGRSSARDSFRIRF
jgi:Ca2+-binding RTX toxin-like protein